MARRETFELYRTKVALLINARADRRLEEVGAGLDQFRACYDAGLNVKRAAERIRNEMYAEWSRLQRAGLFHL